MDLFLLIFFLVIGLVGFVYKVDAGVFVGMGLIPWQIIRLKISKKLNLAAIIITGVAGGIYFVVSSNWTFLAVFLFIELYNYWGHKQTKQTKDE